MVSKVLSQSISGGTSTLATCYLRGSLHLNQSLITKVMLNVASVASTTRDQQETNKHKPFFAIEKNYQIKALDNPDAAKPPPKRNRNQTHQPLNQIQLQIQNPTRTQKPSFTPHLSPCPSLEPSGTAGRSFHQETRGTASPSKSSACASHSRSQS
jgi:hypothetical protein